MALRRLATKPLTRSIGGIKRPADRKLRKRTPLAFIPEEPDPARHVKEGKTGEESIKREVQAVKVGMVERLKQDAKRKKLAVSMDDFFTVAFENGEQAKKFLTTIGYPHPNAPFIDGLILADLFKIKIPAATEKIKPLKVEHDKTLTRLVTKPQWRGKA